MGQNDGFYRYRNTIVELKYLFNKKKYIKKALKRVLFLCEGIKTDRLNGESHHPTTPLGKIPSRYL